MTLARKGSRRIEVDSISYRWTVAANDEPGLAIVVESAGGGQRLVSRVQRGVIIGPGLVALAIRDGLTSGWRPNTRGADVVRTVAELSAVRAAAHQCPVCDYFSLLTRGQYDICPICFWEDDGLEVDQPDRPSGPNHQTLREARANFSRYGACDSTAVQNVLSERHRSQFRREIRQLPPE